MRISVKILTSHTLLTVTFIMATLPTPLINHVQNYHFQYRGPRYQSALLYHVERATAREQLLNAHSALVDIGICAVILDHICQQLGVKTIEDLYVESEKARTPSTMPFGKHKGMSLADVPKHYKKWLLTQQDIDPYLRKALRGG